MSCQNMTNILDVVSVPSTNFLVGTGSVFMVDSWWVLQRLSFDWCVAWQQGIV